MTRCYPRRVSPFGHPRIKAWLAAPRGFSQPPTSFFASRHLGIHHTPFVAWYPCSSIRPTSRSASWLQRAPRSRSSRRPYLRRAADLDALSRFAQSKLTVLPSYAIFRELLRAAFVVELIGLEPTTSCLQ